jgi:hypothetical protein
MGGLNRGNGVEAASGEYSGEPERRVGVNAPYPRVLGGRFSFAYFEPSRETRNLSRDGGEGIEGR